MNKKKLAKAQLKAQEQWLQVDHDIATLAISVVSLTKNILSMRDSNLKPYQVKAQQAVLFQMVMSKVDNKLAQATNDLLSSISDD